MDSLAKDYPAILSEEHDAPCLSLYQPTHRQHPENAQDPIRFRNLVKQMEDSLRQKYPSRDIKELLAPFEALAADQSFWNHTADGLAVLAAPGTFRVYKLLRPVAELVVVADSFHTKPLMRITQSADRFQILALSRQAFKVFEGNRDTLNELAPIDGVPQTSAEQLGLDDDTREGARRVYGPGSASAARHGTTHHGNTQHGTDVKQDAKDHDAAQFFRTVDQVVQQHYSQPSGLPLILAALPEHHHQFRSSSHNPHLLKDALDVHPDNLSLDALRERAWELMLPHYLERLDGFIGAFKAAHGSGLANDDLERIAAAAIAGRVATLLIEADRLIPGRIDEVSGSITKDELNNPEVDDILDDLGERVIKAGGEVVIVPSERMPTKTGAAAIYRF